MTDQGNIGNTRFYSLYPMAVEEAIKKAVQAGPEKENQQVTPKRRTQSKGKKRARNALG